MADRITEVLELHIKVLNKKLDLIAQGVELEESAKEVYQQLVGIQGQLSRHLERTGSKT